MVLLDDIDLEHVLDRSRGNIGTTRPTPRDNGEHLNDPTWEYNRTPTAISYATCEY